MSTRVTTAALILVAAIGLSSLTSVQSVSALTTAGTAASRAPSAPAPSTSTGTGAQPHVPVPDTQSTPLVPIDSNASVASLRHAAFGIVSLTPTGCVSGCSEDINSMVCQGPTFCVAVGGGNGVGPSGYSLSLGYVFYSTDGGASWVSQSLPTNTGQLGGVACSSANCYASGQSYDPTSGASVPEVLSSAGGGWAAVPALPSGDYPNDIACPAADTCYTVGSIRHTSGLVPDIYKTTDGGTKWSSQKVPAAVGAVNFISCPSASDCYATGTDTTGNIARLLATTNGGTTWVTQSVPSGFPQHISCPSTTTCYAAGGSLVKTTDGGTTWTTVSGAGTDTSAVSCFTTTTCDVAGNGTAENTNDGGSDWAHQYVLPYLTSHPATVTCDTATSCFLGGQINDPGIPPACCGTDFDMTVWSDTQSSPLGGAITLLELLGGGFNPCTLCLLKTVAQMGEPVESETGDFWHSFPDISIPGRGIPLTLTRTYNSAAASTNSPFGYGWSFNDGDSLSGIGTDSITLNQENGSAEVFTLSDGFYRAAPRVQAQLTENGNGTYTVARDATQTLLFNTSGQLMSETDRNGYVTTFSYNSNGRLTTVTDQAGRKMTFTWSGGHIVTAADPMGHTYHYAYDSSGDLTKVTNPAGDATTYTYDSSHRMLTMTQPDGGTVTNVYNSNGQVTSQTDPLGRKTTFAYAGDPLSAQGGTTTVTDPAGDVTEYAYQNGLMLSKTMGVGTSAAATWLYRYDPVTLGQVAVVNPDGDGTTTMYDSSGNPTVTTNALGQSTVEEFNQFNEPTSSTDPDGYTTTYTYDDNGNLLTKSISVGGSDAVTRYTYGNSSDPGDLTATTDPDGDTTTYTYDADGDKASTTDDLGDLSTSTYNADGQLTSVTQPDGNVAGATKSYKTTYTYDTLGHVLTTTTPQGHVTTDAYDGDGNLTSVTDAAGHTVTYTYDLADEQTEVKQADGTITKTTYDPDGRMASQTDGNGHTTTYSYDPLGRQASVTNADGRTTSYTHDGDGNLVTITDAEGQVTTRTFNAVNDLTGTTYSDKTTPSVTMAYDADGHLIAMTDGSGSWSWTYNSMHEPTSITEGNSGTVNYTYDLDGHVTSITYPNGQTVTMTYDGAGREASVEDWLGNTTTFAYDADSNLISEQFPESTGELDTTGYDTDGQITTIADTKGATTLFSADYGRDADGTVTSDTSQAAATGSYGYTSMNQLCYAGNAPSKPCASAPAKAATYADDPAGNLTTLATLSKSATTETTQTFDPADQLCWTKVAAPAGACASPPKGATRYAYNKDGDLTSVTPASGTATTLAYDQANRLISDTHGSTTATYTYNGNNLRMSTKVGTTTTDDTWDLTGSIPMLIADGTTYYVFGPGGLPLEQISGSSVLFYHHDDIGSTRLLTSTTGSVTATYTYDPYGNVVRTTGTVDNPFQFTGQYRDPGTGLYYLDARYYDPATAQFLTVDPQVSQTQAPYAYASSNPLGVTDPRGLDGSCPNGIAIPFGLCLDNPFASLQQDEQNFDQNSQALDNTPVAGWVIQQDPFYNAIQDDIYAASGIPVSPGQQVDDILSILALGLPGPSDVLGWLGVDGADSIFSNSLASISENAGEYAADHPWVEETFDLFGGGLAAAAFQQLFPDSSPAQDLALLNQQCGF
jgi:RHS repeat-associated protein